MSISFFEGVDFANNIMKKVGVPELTEQQRITLVQGLAAWHVEKRKEPARKAGLVMGQICDLHSELSTGRRPQLPALSRIEIIRKLLREMVMS